MLSFFLWSLLSLLCRFLTGTRGSLRRTRTLHNHITVTNTPGQEKRTKNHLTNSLSNPCHPNKWITRKSYNVQNKDKRWTYGEQQEHNRFLRYLTVYEAVHFIQRRLSAHLSVFPAILLNDLLSEKWFCKRKKERRWRTQLSIVKTSFASSSRCEHPPYTNMC